MKKPNPISDDPLAGAFKQTQLYASPAEVAEALGFQDVRTIKSLAKSGGIKAVRISNCIRIELQSVREFLKNSEIGWNPSHQS